MIPTNNSYYSSTSNTHRLSHHHPRVCNDRLGAGGETPLSKTRRRGIRCAVIWSPGVAIARLARARPPPPGPRPCPCRRHFRPPLPPACAEPRPPRLVPSSLNTCPPHPCQGFREPSRPPLSPPDGNNDADNQRSVEATTEPLSMDDRPRATQSALSSSPPPRTRRGGEGGTQNTRSLPGSCSRSVRCLRTVIPCRRRWQGGAPAAPVFGRGGSGGIGSGGGDNDIGFGVSIVCMCGV